MKKTLILLGLFIITFYSFGEKKKLMIIDNKTQEELIGVKITVDSITYYTDFDGIVEIDVSDKSTIKVEYPSYETKVLNKIETNIIKLFSK